MVLKAASAQPCQVTRQISSNRYKAPRKSPCKWSKCSLKQEPDRGPWNSRVPKNKQMGAPSAVSRGQPDFFYWRAVYDSAASGAHNDQLWAPLAASRGPRWHPKRSHYDTLQMSPLPLVRFVCWPLCHTLGQDNLATGQTAIGDLWAAGLRRAKSQDQTAHTVWRRSLLIF